MSNDPLRRLAKAIFGAVRRPGRLDLEEEHWRREVAVLARVSRRSRASVRVHHEDRVVAVAGADERDVRPRLVVRHRNPRARTHERRRAARRRKKRTTAQGAAKPSERAARRRGTDAGGRGRRRARGSRLGGDAPADHDELALGEGGRDAEVLLDEQDREPLLLEELERLDQPLDDGRRETFRRLVHHEDLRIRDERTSDREHLLLAARELCAAVPLPFTEPREEVVDALARPLAVAVRRRPSASDSQVLVDGERRKEPATLRHVADSRAARSCATRHRRARRRRSGSSPAARGGEMPMIALQSVVLPMPFRPTIAIDSCPIEKVTSSSACALP